MHLVVARPGTGSTLALRKLQENSSSRDDGFTVLYDDEFEVCQSAINDLFTGDVFTKLVRRLTMYRTKLLEHDDGDSYVVVEKGAACFFHVDIYLIYCGGLITSRQYLTLRHLYESLFSPVIKYKGKLCICLVTLITHLYQVPGVLAGTLLVRSST